MVSQLKSSRIQLYATIKFFFISHCKIVFDMDSDACDHLSITTPYLYFITLLMCTGKLLRY